MARKTEITIHTAPIYPLPYELSRLGKDMLQALSEDILEIVDAFHGRVSITDLFASLRRQPRACVRLSSGNRWSHIRFAHDLRNVALNLGFDVEEHHTGKTTVRTFILL